MKLGGTHWDESGCSVDIWKPFQTWVKQVLVCSVNRVLNTHPLTVHGNDLY